MELDAWSYYVAWIFRTAKIVFCMGSAISGLFKYKSDICNNFAGNVVADWWFRLFFYIGDIYIQCPQPDNLDSVRGYSAERTKYWNWKSEKAASACYTFVKYVWWTTDENSTECRLDLANFMNSIIDSMLSNFFLSSAM